MSFMKDQASDAECVSGRHSRDYDVLCGRETDRPEDTLLTWKHWGC